MRKPYVILLIGMFIVPIFACNDFLDAKPDKKLAVTSTLNDLQALLDAYFDMNLSYHSTGEEASDDYFLTSESWESISNIDSRNYYIWADNGSLSGPWGSSYEIVFTANTILDDIQNIEYSTEETSLAHNIIGSALFFRSFAFYEAVQLFAPAYNSHTLNEPGIPLRLDPDFNALSTRANVAESYGQILSDLNKAVELLPDINTEKNRPSKAGAYALLARIHLAMSQYEEALKNATLSLEIYDKLMDYKNLSVAEPIPIKRFNDEVIFSARTAGASALLSPAKSRVDTLLYDSYKSNDLRKAIYFVENNDGYHTFKGCYDGNIYGQLFKGIAVDEVYLIKAECLIREGNVDQGLEALATLLKNRYIDYTVESDLSVEEALNLVLAERRKELLYRGLRWTDIKRLNIEGDSSIKLKRILGNNIYELLPGDPRFVFLIPIDIIDRTGMPQNRK